MEVTVEKDLQREVNLKFSPLKSPQTTPQACLNGKSNNNNIELHCKQELQQQHFTATVRPPPPTYATSVVACMNLETLAEAASTTPPSVHGTYENLLKYTATTQHLQKQQYTAADNDAALNLTSMSQAAAVAAD